MILSLINRLCDWMEADIERMDRELEQAWAKTDLGMLGIPRASVPWFRRKLEIHDAARKGRY